MVRNAFNILICFCILIFPHALNGQVRVSGDTTICGEATIEWTPEVIGQSTAYNIVNIPFGMEPVDSLTPIYLSDEDISDLIPLGFDFCFFDSVYTYAWLYSNGFLGFDYSLSYQSNYGPDTVGELIPTDSVKVPKNCIMSPWTDLYNYGYPNVYYFGVKGSAPSRRFIFFMDSVSLFGFGCITQKVSSQIILYEGSGVIRCNILSKPVCEGWAWSRLSTQGIHNHAGSVAYVNAGRNATEWEAYNESILFVPSGDIFWTVNGTPVESEIPFVYTIDSTVQIIASAYDCSGMYHADTILITVDTMSEAMIIPDGPTDLCAGDSLVLTSDSPVSNTWSTGDTTQSITVVASGVYILTIENFCLTDAVDSIEVTVHDLPVVADIYETAGTLHTDAIGTCQWYLDGEPIAGATESFYIPAETGTYTVEVTDAFGCTGISDAYYYELLSTGDINAFQIRVDPNPAYEMITITAPSDDFIYSILSVSGVVIKEGNSLSSLEKFSVAGLPPGMYILVIKGDNYFAVRSWIKG